MSDEKDYKELMKDMLWTDASDESGSERILRKFMDPVIEQALEELFVVKNSFESLQSDFEYDKVQDIQDRLRLISGSMIMLNLTRIANALNACNQFITAIPARPDIAFLDHDGSRLFLGLLDEMSYYLEGLSADVNQQESLLTEVESNTKRLVSLSSSLTSYSLSNERSVMSDQNRYHDDLMPSYIETSNTLSPEDITGREKVDDDLRRQFMRIAGKYIKSGRMVLHMLQKSRDSGVLIKEFRKVLASLSTGALDAGLEEVVELSHGMELLIVLLQRSDEQHREEINELLDQSYEQLSSLVDQYIHRETINPVEEQVFRISRQLTEPVDGLTQGVDHDGNGEQIALRHPHPAVPDEHSPGRPDKTQNRPSYRPASGIRDRTEEHVDRMDDMQHAIDETYELLRSYIDELKHETGQLRNYIRIARSSSASGNSENSGDNDSLLNEYLDESDRAHDQNLKQLNQLGQHIEQQRQIIASMKAGLRQARIVSIESRIKMLEHVVRHKADEQSKIVTLNVIGQHIRLDRILLDNLIEPLKCLIGFCIEHGIEVAVSRVNSGKPLGGTITLEFTKQGMELVINIRDDGIAIDSAGLRQRAVELGYIHEKEPFTIAELSMLMFNGGFNRESNLAGLKSSGIQLSDIARIVKAMGGDVTYNTSAAAGNSFTICVPCELNVMQALTVQVDSEIYAIPLANVDDVLYLGALEIDALRSLDEHIYKYKGYTYQFRNLAMVLGFEQRDITAGGDAQYPVILISMGNKRIALQVDQIKGQREVIINQPVPEMNRVKVISGATLLSDKRLVLVLELGALLGEDVGNLKAIRQLSIT